MTSPIHFFPELAIEKDARGDAFLREWYSAHLNAMHEPSLSCGVDRAHTVYRFTWLRTFHHPVAVRIEKNAQGGVQLTAVELSGAGGYEPESVQRSKSRAIEPEEWQQLERKLAKGVFKAGEREQGLDGSEWIFERAVAGTYDVSVAWSPASGPKREAGMLLLSLTGWTFGEIY